MNITFQFYFFVFMLFNIIVKTSYACSIPNPLTGNIVISDCTQGNGSSTLTLDAQNTADTIRVNGNVILDYTTVYLKNGTHVIVENGADLNITGSLNIDATSSMVVIGDISSNIATTNHGELVLHNNHIFSTLANHGYLYGQFQVDVSGSLSNSGHIKVGEILNISGSASNYNAYIYAGDTTIVGGAFAFPSTVEHHYTFPEGDSFWDHFSDEELPVELIFFKSLKIEEGYLIKWSTAMEINSAYFLLESSYDKRKWSTFYSVHAQGNSNSKTDYSYQLDGDNASMYLRLVQVDMDGQQEVYGPIYIEREDIDINIFPTQLYGREALNIKINAPIKKGDKVLCTLMNTNGKIISKIDIDTSYGLDKLKVIPNVTAGIYIICIEYKGRLSSQKIVIN